MGDSSIDEQAPSSCRNMSVNTNAQSSFITLMCVWVQRLRGNVQSTCAHGHTPSNACSLSCEAIVNLPYFNDNFS
jgi:hypothetical protein